MNALDLILLSPQIALGAATIVLMLAIAFRRNLLLSAVIAGAGFIAALLCEIIVLPHLPHPVAGLLIADRLGMFFVALILLSGLAVTALSHAYLKRRAGKREEFFLLLLIASLGASVLAQSSHFASFFLGLEILTVSLYGLIAYLRDSAISLEAGIKYLVLAAVSSAFLLFGMALLYAETGSMEFGRIAVGSLRSHGLLLPLAGSALLLVGIGFKLALVPFHLWTPDVYEGAPAPVTAFVATSSKGAVFAVLLRVVDMLGPRPGSSLFLALGSIAVLSMFAGNLLALNQKNLKRILAYSSIAHSGYLLVAYLAGGPGSRHAVAFYLAAYFCATLAAFGVLTVLSGSDRDEDDLEEYRGLAWRRPWIAAVLLAAILSLAGIPLTAGFIGKFYLVAAGVGAMLWVPVFSLVAGSVIGLFYYLRVVAALFGSPGKVIPFAPAVSIGGGAALAVLMLLLFWLGVHPEPLLDVLRAAIR